MSAAQKQKERALEALLVARSRGGDRRAMAQLVELRGPRLYAHAARLLGEAEGARDVVQEAWVEILRSLPGLREDGAFLPWALRIVSRRVARDIRRRQKGRVMAQELRADGAGVTPEAGPGAVDGARLRAAVATLPGPQRAAVALFYLEEMSVAEVAVALDVPVGTVKTRLMHARARLRGHLDGGSDGQAG